MHEFIENEAGSRRKKTFTAHRLRHLGTAGGSAAYLNAEQV